MTTAALSDLHVSVTGAGPAIVLLHAFGLEQSIWTPQAEALSKRATVVLVDLRGMGRSPASGGTYTWEGHARDVLRVLDDRAIERAVLVGHSYSAWIVARVHGLAPARVAGGAFVGSAPAPIEGALRDALEKLAEGTQRRGAAAVAETFGGLFTGPTTQRTRPEIAARVDAILAANDARGALETVRGMLASTEWAPPIDRIDVPWTVLAGTEDAFITRAQAQALAARMPHAELVLVGGGHVPSLEAPDATTEALARLLDRAHRA